MTSGIIQSDRPGAVALREVLARRGADRIALFHTDHFEPWGRRGKLSLPDWRKRGADKVHRFAERMARLPHGRRLGLHYLPDLSIERARPGLLMVAGDAIGIAPRGREDDELAACAFADLPGEVAFDLQVHFHHERLTWNRTSATGPFPEAFAINDVLLNRQRFDLGLAEALRRIRNDTGRALSSWFFVHGLWSLNASDLDACSITDEIARLRAAGCLGDFTFPAGRTHCDPPFDTPSLVRPVDAPKGYACGQADPCAPGTSLDQGRFFIWSSRTVHADASLDFGSPEVAENFANVAPWAERLLMGGVQIGRTIAIKTHAHSLFPLYFEDASGVPGGQFPHEHPSVRRLVDMLDRASGGALDFPTPTEVHGRFMQQRSPGEALGYGSEGFTAPRVHAERADAATRVVLSERLERLGEEAGGLGSHYRLLVERGRVIQSSELLLLDLLQRLLPPDMPIVQLRSGAGVLALALALGGRKVVSVEWSTARHAAQAEVARELAAREPAFGERFTLVRRAPASLDTGDVAGACLLLTDFETRLKPGEEAHVRALMGDAAVTLFDAGRFGERRRGDAGRRFGQGFTGSDGRQAVSVLDLGDAMQLYLLDNRRPLAPAAGRGWWPWRRRAPH